MAILSEDVEACIEACDEAIKAANVCLGQHIGEEAMKDCLLLCEDCIDLTTACAQMMARGSTHALAVCGVCADVCEATAEECETFDSEACRLCAEACRRCAERCRHMGAAAA